MDSSDQPDTNGKSCVPVETLEEIFNNKDGNDGVTQREVEPVLLSLFPVAPDLQPWRIVEESCIIVTPSENTTAGQSSTQPAGTSPESLENQSAQHGPPVRNPNLDVEVDRSRITARRQRNAHYFLRSSCNGSRSNINRHIAVARRHPRFRR